MISTAKFGFEYKIEQVRNGAIIDTEIVRNLVPTEGLNYILNTILKNGTPAAAWYVGIYEGNYAPTASITAATIVAASTESVAYTPVTRPAWTGGAVVAGAVDNSLSKAAFTSTGTPTLYGAFLVSTATRGGGTGTLLSAVKFASPKILGVGDIFNVTAGLVLLSA